MWPEVGHYALIWALVFALAQGVFPLLGYRQKSSVLIRSSSFFAYAQCAMLALSFAFLMMAFVRNDFSVAYVAMHSSTQLPWIYRLCAVWSGHEGSLLLWVFLLSLWGAVFAWGLFRLPPGLRFRMLTILGWVSVALLVLIEGTSNPFLRWLPDFPSEGQDLNPLLQDPGFVIHPPLLYMGYVGFSIPFAWAMASLWKGRLNRHALLGLESWAKLAWCFLTLGITLGSWWAYRELGWGGFWFWDPVENASFLPWLSGTVLLHALSLVRMRGVFQAWAMLVAIVTFLLSLFGTFLVRSGVLISVHAFATDPTRGIVLLLLLAIATFGAICVFATRVPQFEHVPFRASVWSLEYGLVYQNLLMMAALCTVFLGTCYPLLMDALGLDKLSVGPPYFNTVLAPTFGVVLFCMGSLAWVPPWAQVLSLRLLWGAFGVILLVVVVLVYALSGGFDFWFVLGVGLSLWVLIASVKSCFARNKKWSFKRLGVLVAHFGVGVCALGVVVTLHSSEQTEVRMRIGDKTALSGYVFELLDAKVVEGPNYTGVRAVVSVQNDRTWHRLLYPEQRVYSIARMALAKTAIDIGFFRDVYVALGESLPNDAWSLRIYYKPFVRWIWVGALLMVLGALLGLRAEPQLGEGG